MAEQPDTTSSAVGAADAATRRGHHRRTSSLLPSLNSLGSFLASAGGLANPASAAGGSSEAAASRGGLSTEAELVFSHPTPTEWADDASPRRPPAAEPRARLGDEVRFRGELRGHESSIAFPTPATPATRSSSAASTPLASETLLYSPEASSAASSADTPATSVRYSPRSTPKDMLRSMPPAPPSEATVKAETAQEHTTFATLPRSFAQPTSAAHRTSSMSAASGRRAAARLDEALASDEPTVQRHAGFRARSIHSIRGLAAAWVPARFVPTSQPSSSASTDASSSLDPASPRHRDALALVPAASDEAKRVVRHADEKRPVKLDRRRLDKAVTLAVEAAQAAEEDERIWEHKRRSARRKLTAHASDDELAPSDDERASDDDDDDDDDLGFSLDLYISSLGYLISALSDKEAPGLSRKQRDDIKQRLDEGMAKLGFDARAELARAEDMRRELELERQKLALERQHGASATANVVHHHYHTAVPAGAAWAGEGGFARAHAAAKASSRGSSSLAGKLGSSVLDIGLHIGAGALSALSANLAAIAPRGMRRESKEDKLHDPRITDLDSDEELPGAAEQRDASSPVLSPSQPGSGAATPRTAWTRAISQNNKQWELAVAFASTAASALASSLGAVARSDEAWPDAPTSSIDGQVVLGPLTLEQQQQLARYGHVDAPGESAEDRLILLSASLARALKRSPLPTQLYQLLRQMVSILGALDARYRVSEKGTQLALRETSRALRFVRRHDLHIKAVRVAWAAAEAAVAALEAYRDEPAWANARHIDLPPPAQPIEDGENPTHAAA